MSIEEHHLLLRMPMVSSYCSFIALELIRKNFEFKGAAQSGVMVINFISCGLQIHATISPIQEHTYYVL